ncbi:hypothetical protein GUJ93_ZPchr0004g39924 [Zizania palustris]|uniref:Uncharacterized protein n=1 Tax=Zizania palustris TaxID=103762 RepID=A0A8J5SP25_ZIZPA|nr:hypothetical protein GUJ93_ZPchr0004g39924 [Zizania palustris]
MAPRRPAAGLSRADPPQPVPCRAMMRAINAVKAGKSERERGRRSRRRKRGAAQYRRTVRRRGLHAAPGDDGAAAASLSLSLLL